jgi:hypothetical protein
LIGILLLVVLFLGSEGVGTLRIGQHPLAKIFFLRKWGEKRGRRDVVRGSRRRRIGCLMVRRHIR